MDKDDIKISICEYGRGAATPGHDVDGYIVTDEVSQLWGCKFPCHNPECNGLFDVHHILAALPRFWPSPIQRVECSNDCGNYLEISYKIPSSTE